MEKYQCEICGKRHNLYNFQEYPEPDYLHNLSKEERENRVEETGDMLLIDKSFLLVKGIIFIEIKDISDWFSFEVWVRIEVKYFLERLEEDKDGVSDKPFYGTLENDIFFYGNAKGAKVDVIFPAEGKQIRIEVLEKNHPMTIDQKNGISKEKLISWMQKMHHPKPIKKNSKKESFQVSFDKIIQKAKTEYFAKQKSFIIDVGGGMILFQIVSPDILNLEKREDGFVIYLPFDTSGEEAKDELERFKKTKYFEEFEYDDFDGMPTYFLVLENEKELKNYLKQIIKEVYQTDVERVEFDIFEP